MHLTNVRAYHFLLFLYFAYLPNSANLHQHFAVLNLIQPSE